MAAWAVLVCVAVLTGILSTLPVVPAPVAVAAPASWVQSTGTANDATSVSISRAFASNNTAGNTIVVAASWGNVAPLVCSDTRGNRYTTIVQRYDSSNFQSVGICYANNITAGANTVTATFTAANAGYRRIIVSEYANVADHNPIDVRATASGAGNSTTDGISSSNATTTSDGDLIFGVVGSTNGLTSISPGTGFTERASVLGEEVQIQDRIQSKAGSIASIHTFSGVVPFVSLMVAFRSQGGTAKSAPTVAGDGIAIYSTSDGNTGTATSKLYDSRTNSFSSELPAFGGMAASTVIRTSPKNREAIAAWQDWYGNVTVACFDGTAWSVDWVDVMGAGATTRVFDVAYETATGDALVTYDSLSTTTSVAYRTKPGSTGCGSANWSSESTYNPSSSAGLWYAMKSIADRRASSNLIAVAGVDSANDMTTFIWNGTAFVTEPAAALETSMATINPSYDADSFDLDWESQGDLMVVWGDSSGTNGTNGAYYATCTGGVAACTWSAKTRIGGATGDDAKNIDISANPLSNEMVYASVGSAGSDLQVGYWSGTAWTLVPNLDTSTQTPITGSSMVATAYLTKGSISRSVVAYADSAAGDVLYYTGDGPTFTTANSPLTYDVTNTNALRSLSAQVDPLNNDRMMLTLADIDYAAWAKQATLDGSGSLVWTSPDGNAKLHNALPQFITNPIAFAYWNTTSMPALTQNGYIFENDDEDQAEGDSVDENTQQAGANTSISSVKKGERVTARFQLSNTGSPLTSDLALFYDRNDGVWSKVQTGSPAVTGIGTCDSSPLFDCSAVDTAGSTGYWSSVAVDQAGSPWIAYTDYTNNVLRVAHYVGSAGTGCANVAWTCSTIGSAGLAGEFANIAIDPSGNPWVSHYDSANDALRIARFVGTGGSGCGTNTAWSCELIDNSTSPGVNGTSIAFDASGVAWLSYYENDNEELRVARYVGAGGNCPSSTQWFCQTVTTPGDIGQWSSIGFDAQNRAWVSFMYGSDGELWYAKYVGSGGTGCTATAAWTCGTVDTGATGTVGGYTSLAFDASGNPWISYYDWSNLDLRVARYVGTGGNCATAEWSCSAVDTTGDVGAYSSIAMDPSGTPWVVSSDATNGNLRAARYVGSSGSGCADSAWTCFTIEATNQVGTGPGVAFGPDGTAWISHLDYGNGDLRVSKLKRGGEITVAPGTAGKNGDPLSETHTDMSSASDTTNRDDADCTTAGAYFNIGRWYENDNASGVPLGSGSATKQCTEVSFVLNTSQATAGTTYRFILASKDSLQQDAGPWRGAGTVSNYATMSVEAATTLRVGKDNAYNPSACTAATWSCLIVDDANTVRPTRTGLAFDGSGGAWAAYQHETAGDIWVTRYVGTGGSGCSFAGSPEWSCSAVDTANDLQYPTLGVDPSGQTWIAYYDNTNKDVRLAKYVGAGGTGCASVEWTCTAVYTNNVTGSRVSLAFDAKGKPVVAFTNVSNYLTVARYLGDSGMGSGCAVATWQCDVVTSVATAHPAVAVDGTGTTWVVYRETAGNTTYVAQFTGSGAGSGCAALSWSCTQIDNTANSGHASAIAIGPNNIPWIVYRNDTNTRLRVATMTAGSGCASAAWTCTDVMTSTDSKDPSIAFDAAGAAWISFGDDTNDDLWIARYVGTSGTGCASTAWACTLVDSVFAQGQGTSLAFDKSGVPWVSYVDYLGWDLKIANMPMSPLPPSHQAVNPAGAADRNAGTGDARYRLDHGDVSRPLSGSCDATATRQGYCALSADDTQYDSMTANAKEIPVYTFAARSSSNAALPSFIWTGRTSVAASTRAVKIDVYRFGSTNAWVNLATNTTVATNTDFNLIGTASAGVGSEYWQADGGNYWTYYRVWQASHGSAETLTTDTFGNYGNVAPNAPSSLAQKSTSDANIATNGWHNSTQVKFTALVSDTNNPDTLELCVEAVPVSASFTNTQTGCGTPVSYSGTATAASVTLTLSDTVEYHWQARTRDAYGIESTWSSYGGNSDVVTAARDFALDATAPDAGMVYDGASSSTDVNYNDGSLNTLVATWTGFTANISGLNHYEYTIGTTAGGTDIRSATSTLTATTVTATGLTLRTGQVYFFRVFAYDNAGNVTSADSNGQMVAPTLSFTLDKSTIDFGRLNSSNSYSSTQSMTATVTTNAYNGYQVLQKANGVLTSSSGTIAMYSGTWASPTVWVGGTGFGYTSSDTNVGGSNRFATSSNYAGLSVAAPHVVADSSAAAPAGASYTLDYKVQSSLSQAAGSYSTVVELSALPSY
jgi:hypothetical protein